MTTVVYDTSDNTVVRYGTTDSNTVQSENITALVIGITVGVIVLIILLIIVTIAIIYKRRGKKKKTTEDNYNNKMVEMAPVDTKPFAVER